jgi:lysophospholipase L1-like esterase
MSLASLAAAVSVMAAGSPDVGCTRALCGAEALSPYFAALAHARAGDGDGGPPRTVHILDIGDSHSAGDSITGPWREILQSRFGSGGRGVLPPGKPFDGFLPHGVHVDQSAGWTAENSFRADPAAPPAFGVSGFRLTSTQDAAQLTLTAEPQEMFRRLVVCAEARPGAGAYVVTLGAISARVVLDAPLPRVDCESFAVGDLQTQATLVTQGGPVTLTSWASFSDAGGVVVSNLGVVGAELKHFARTDDQAVREELRAYRPDLILLEFGTNDGFVGHFGAAGFESRLRAQITRMKRLSGGASILIVGAPDAETRRPELRHNDDEGEPVPIERETRSFVPAAPAPLDGPEAENPGEATIAAQAEAPRDQTLSSEARPAWYSPPALAQVRAIERRVALETGAAFWDWGARMGGPGAADRWANAAPPLTRADHVHTTTAGGAQVAAMLQSDLDQAYAAWSASRSGP